MRTENMIRLFAMATGITLFAAANEKTDPQTPVVTQESAQTLSAPDSAASRQPAAIATNATAEQTAAKAKASVQATLAAATKKIARPSLAQQEKENTLDEAIEKATAACGKNKGGGIIGFGETIVGGLAVLFIFGGPFIVVLMILMYRYRKHKLLHATVAAMIEKGMPIPPELLHCGRPPQSAVLMRGIVWLAIGTGLCVFFLQGHNRGWAFALIPLMTGMGYLIAWWLQRKDKAE